MTRRALAADVNRKATATSTPLTNALARVDQELGDCAVRWFERFDWRRHRREQELLPEIALAISRTLRAGRPLELALAEASERGHVRLQQTSEQLSAGRPLRAAIDDWACAAPAGAEQLLVAAISMGCDSGSDLARALDLVGDGIRDDLQLDARRRTLLTQSRLSAAVLVALPLVFAAVASMLQGEVIYQGVSGATLLVVGLGLDLIGMAWIKRLLGGLQ